MHFTSPEPLVNTRTACQIHSHAMPAKNRGDKPGQNEPDLNFQGLSARVRKEEDSSPQVTRTPQLTDLPCEIVSHIADRLDIRSIAALTQTCRYINGAVRGMAADKVARYYYGAPGSQSRHLYDQLYTPLARRQALANPESDSKAMPLTEEQQARQRLHQITRLRTLSQNGKLKPACQFFAEAGSFKLVTSGWNRLWGACALICRKQHSQPLYGREFLSIVLLEPAPSLIALPPVEQPCLYHVASAQVLADGYIITAGMTTTHSHQRRHFILTVCRHNNHSGALEHVALAGAHGDTVVRFGQLPDGRIVSASHDTTLKIRPLAPPDESLVITLTGHLDKITDMLLFAASRCITSSCDRTLKIWDLGSPSKERCVATLTDSPRIVVKLHQLNENHFLSESAPDIFLVWRLTDSGAECSAILDPDWTIKPPTDNNRTAKEEPYHLLSKPILFHNDQTYFKIQVLPGGRVAVHHWSGTRLCDPTGSHREPKRVCILTRNSHGAVTCSLPICPVGPHLPLPVPRFQLAGLMPDGRVVCVDPIGNINLYSLANPDTISAITLGNLFSACPQKSVKNYRHLQNMMVMSDGRLFVSTQTAGHKTLFFVYDPYVLPDISHLPGKEN